MIKGSNKKIIYLERDPGVDDEITIFMGFLINMDIGLFWKEGHILGTLFPYEWLKIHEVCIFLYYFS